MTATLEAFPALYSHKNLLDAGPDCLGRLRDSSDALEDAAALRQRIQEEGYLYLPGLLNRNEVLAARREVTDRLAAEGLLDSSRPSIDAIPKPNTKMAFRPDLAEKNAALEKVLYSGPMTAFFMRFLGGALRHYDFTWLRAIAPGVTGTNSHCDIVYMGRGTTNLFTAWTPLGDVPFDLGGLMILEGSNRNDRLKSTYGQKDVDSFCSNKRGEAAKDGWSHGVGGGLGKNPNIIRRQVGRGGRWLTTEYRAGDVLIFTMFTVHASMDNRADSIRLSTDSRYQLASEPADERWVGDNPPGHSTAGKRGRIC